MKVDEKVPVETTDDGAPLRFVWRGVVYGVVSPPEHNGDRTVLAPPPPK